MEEDDDHGGGRKVYVYDHKRSVPPVLLLENDDDEDDEEPPEVEPQNPVILPPAPVLPRSTAPAPPKIRHLMTPTPTETETEVTIPPTKIQPPPPPKIAHLLTETSAKGSVTIQAQITSKDKDNKDDSKSCSRDYRSRSRSPFNKYKKRGRSRSRSRSRNRDRDRGRNRSTSSSSGSDDVQYYNDLIKRSKICLANSATTTSADKDLKKPSSTLAELFDIYNTNKTTVGPAEPEQITRHRELVNINLQMPMPPPILQLQNNPHQIQNQTQFIGQEMNPCQFQNSWRPPCPFPHQNPPPPPWASHFHPQFSNYPPYLPPPPPPPNPNNFNLRPPPPPIPMPMMCNKIMPYQGRPIYIQRNYFNYNNTMNFVQNCPRPMSIPLHLPPPQYAIQHQHQQQPQFYIRNQNGLPIRMPIPPPMPIPRFLPPQVKVEAKVKAAESNENENDNNKNKNKIISDTGVVTKIIEIDRKPSPVGVGIHSSEISSTSTNEKESDQSVESDTDTDESDSDTENETENEMSNSPSQDPKSTMGSPFIKSSDIIVQLRDLLDKSTAKHGVQISLEEIQNQTNQTGSSDNSGKNGQEIMKDSIFTISDEEDDDDDVMIIEEIIRITDKSKSKTTENNTHSPAKNVPFLSKLPSQLGSDCDSFSDIKNVIMHHKPKPTAKIHPNISPVKDKVESAADNSLNQITNEKEVQKDTNTNPAVIRISTGSGSPIRIISGIEIELEDKESGAKEVQIEKDNSNSNESLMPIISHIIEDKEKEPDLTKNQITEQNEVQMTTSHLITSFISTESPIRISDTEDTSTNQPTKVVLKDTSPLININNICCSSTTESPISDIVEESQNSSISSSSSSSDSSSISEAQIAANIDDSSDPNQGNTLKKMCTIISENMKKASKSLTTATSALNSSSTETEEAIKDQQKESAGIEIVQNMIRKTYVALKDFQDKGQEQELEKNSNISSSSSPSNSSSSESVVDSSESDQDNSLKKMCTNICENLEKASTSLNTATTALNFNSTDMSISTESEAIKNQESGTGTGLEMVKKMIRKAYLTFKDFQDKEREKEIKIKNITGFPTISIEERSIYFLLLAYLYRMKEDTFAYQYHTHGILLLLDIVKRLLYHSFYTELVVVEVGVGDVVVGKSQLLESNLNNFLESFYRIMSEFLPSSAGVYDNLEDFMDKDFTHYVLKEIKDCDCDTVVETSMHLIISDISEGVDGHIRKIGNLIESLFIPRAVKQEQSEKLEAIKQVWDRLKVKINDSSSSR